MTNALYSIERDVVDPVFFAVVPDSFMTRVSTGHVSRETTANDFGWADEQDAPIVAPQDRWSF
ncbi:MAG TPA: hypothetical protein VES39_05175 [Rhodospirillales bacterium]|nr:hypothetical protein [Rhodospirillales bacterium]